MGQTQRMGNRVIIWGMGVCLALLALELSVLAVAGNLFALTVTLGAVGAMAAATYLKVRQMDHSRRPRLYGARGVRACPKSGIGIPRE